MFHMFSENHSRYLHSKKHLRVPHPRTDLFKTSLSYSVAVIWNNLPVAMRNSTYIQYTQAPPKSLPLQKSLKSFPHQCNIYLIYLHILHDVSAPMFSVCTVRTCICTRTYKYSHKLCAHNFVVTT